MTDTPKAEPSPKDLANQAIDAFVAAMMRLNVAPVLCTQALHEHQWRVLFSMLFEKVDGKSLLDVDEYNRRMQRSVTNATKAMNTPRIAVARAIHGPGS